ncbi:MAG TPA: phage tail tip lysozyme [Trebonia sp.]|jgi:hypothetical protein|nr:phage tail tip lysozyme [Trebonia sp.]
MAEYSYAGLSVVVRAVTEPMTAAIRKDAVAAGEAASLALEKTISAGIRNGLRAGWSDTASRSAARAAATAAAAEFGAAMTEGVAKAGAAAGEALGSMKAPAARSAKAAAAAAGETFSKTLVPAVAAAGRAAADAMAGPMTAGAEAAGAEAGAAAGRAFALTMGRRMKAITAGPDLGGWAAGAEAAGAKAGAGTGEAFNAALAASMKAGGAGAAWTWRAEVIPGMAKAGGMAAITAGDAMDAGLRTRMSVLGREAGARFTAAMDEMIRPGMARVGASVKTGMKHVASTAGNAVKAVGLVAGVLGGGFLGYAIKAGVAYNVLYQKSQKAFETILGSQKAADKMMTNLAKFAKTSPFPRQTFITATQQMLGFGVSAKNVIPTLSAVQDAVAAVGGNANDILGVVNVLAKVQSQGKFTARTLNEMGIRGIDAATLIGKGMNMTSAQVRKAITKDTLNSQTAMTVLVQQMQIRYRGAAAGLKSTWTGAKQSIQAAMRDIGSALVEPFISKKGGGLAIQWANKLGKVLWKLEPLVQPLADALMVSLAPAINAVNKAIDWLLNQVDKLSGANMKTATDAVKKFGAAALGVGVALSAITASKFLAGIPLIGDVVTGLLGPFTELAGLMLDITNPIAWVVDGIILIVVASSKLRASLSQFGKAFMKDMRPVLTQIVAGFKELWPYVWNLAKTIGDSLTPVVQHLTKFLKPLGVLLALMAHVIFKELAMEAKFLAPVLKVAFRIIGDVLIWLIDGPLTWLVKAMIWVFIKLKFFTDHTKVVFTTIARVLFGIWRPFEAETVRIWNAVVGALTVAYKAVAGVVMAIVHAVTTAWNAVWAASVAVWNVIVTVIKLALAVIGFVINVWLILVRAIFLAAFEIWRGIFRTFWGWIGPYVMAVFRALVAVIKFFMAPIVLIITAAWTLIRIAVTASVNWLKTAIPAAWHWITAVTARAWNDIAAPVSHWYHNVVGWVKTALNWIKGASSAVWSWVTSNTAQAWNATGAVVLSWYHNVVGWLTAAFNWVKSRLAAAWRWVSDTTATLWGKIAAPLLGFWNVIKTPLTKMMDWIKGLFSGAWAAIVSAATGVGGDVLRVLKSGFETAWKDISSWVKAQIVDPIIGAVRRWFHIPGGSGGGGAATGRAGGPQGGGGASVAAAAAGGAAGAAAAGGGGGGGSLWGNVGDMFKGMLHDVVSANPVETAEHVFGSMAKALGWMVVRGVVAANSLPLEAMSVLEKIPGVQAAMGWLGSGLSGAWNFAKGLAGLGGGGGLVSRALGFGGHPYVWGGGANPATGFDCSSFVNMVAGMAGLPIPGGFRAPSSQHGPVTTNWLGYGGLTTVPYDSMMPGDLYINTGHMGIVTGKGTGFAARSTASGTGAQSVPRGVYTIRRFPGGGGVGGGVAGSADVLAQALAGLLSQSQGLVPVIAGSSSQNLETIARYMAGHGWSLPGAAGVAGNVWRESLGDPLSYGSGGRGLIGWTPPNTLPNSAFIAGNPSASLSRQLPLVNSFFRGNMGRYWSLANAQSDAGRAALVIMNMGERPAGSSQSNPFYGGSGTSAGSSRAAMARNIFELLRQSATVKMASGGVIREPVAGLGASGTRYLLGEAGPEGVLPAKLLEYLRRLLARMAAARAPKGANLGNVWAGSPLPAVTAAPKQAAAKTVKAHTAASEAVRLAAIAAAAAAKAGGATTGAAARAAKAAHTAAVAAAKVAATIAARAAKVAATNTAAMARTVADNAERLAKAAAENTARLAKAQASIAARDQRAASDNAARNAKTRTENTAALQRAAQTNAAELAKAQAHQYANAKARQNALSKVSIDNAERLTKAQSANAARLAKANTSDANALAKAQINDNSALAKAKAGNTANLAKAEAANTAALAKAQATALENLEKTGISAAEAMRRLAAQTAGIVAAAAGKPVKPTLGNVRVRLHPRLGGMRVTPGLVSTGPVAIHDQLADEAARKKAIVEAEHEAALRKAAERARRGLVTVNVYPRASQSETEIAAAVSRSLGWAAQGGAH